MANWSAGLKTLGEGLGRMGVVKKQEEENHLEQLRREALEKIRQTHDVAMLDKRMAHDKDLFTARSEADETRHAASEESAERRLNAQLGAQEKQSERQAIANINADATRQLVAISNARQKLQQEMAKQGGMADPQSIAQWQEMLAGLDEQEKATKSAQMFMIRRVQTNDWGTEMAEEDVRTLLGAKGENSEDVMAAAVAGAPAPAAAHPAAGKVQRPAATDAVTAASPETEVTGARVVPEGHLAPDEGIMPGAGGDLFEQDKPGFEAFKGARQARDWLQGQRSGRSQSDRRRGGSQ